MAPNPALARAPTHHPLRVHVGGADGGAGLAAALAALAGEIELVAAEAAEVVVWDAGGDGAGVAAQLPALAARAAEAVPVVALLPDERWARAAIDAGIRGVLRRGGGGVGLHAALVAVSHGLTVLDVGFGPTA